MKKLKKIISAVTVFSMLFTSVLPVRAADDFTYKLNELMPTDENYMFSPLSIKTALAMAANGADGETKKELTDALGIEDIDEFNSYISNLTQQYADKTESGDGIVMIDGGSDSVFNIANSIWLNLSEAGDVEFSPEYKAAMAEYYNASAETVNKDTAVKTINEWCSQNTNGKIDEIISSADFLACLVNTVYFKGQWSEPFREYSTKKDVFTDRNGQKWNIDFMHKTDDFKYYADDDIKMIELPYADGKFSMYLALSNDKRVDFSQYFDKLEYKDVVLSLPKFKIEYDTDLVESMQTLGVESAFAPTTDFAKMFTVYQTYFISKITHKTYIDVDEKGTEAAAATAVHMVAGSAAGGKEPEYEYFTADKPFTFIIAEKANNEILFIGEYAFVDEGEPVDEPTESTTEPTTESTSELSAEPTSETTETDIAVRAEPVWYESGVAAWTPYADINSGNVGCEYEVKLFKSGLDTPVDKRTVTAEYIPETEYYLVDGSWYVSPARPVEKCTVDLSETMSGCGEGIYYFWVSSDYDKGESVISPYFYYTEKGFEDSLTVFSENMTDNIAAAGKNPEDWLHGINCRVSDTEVLKTISDRTVYDENAEVITADDDNPPSYRQLIFKPQKAGVVTVTIEHTLAGEVFESDECTYIIDNELKAHVYKPSKGYLVGDADNDGRLTAADSANVLQKALISTFETPVELVDKENYLVAEGNTVYDRAAVMDVNKNGSIDADDAARILQTTLTGK